MNQEQFQELKEIVDTEIGVGYLTIEEIEATMNDSNYTWFIATDTAPSEDEHDLSLHTVETGEESVDGEFAGVMRGRVVESQQRYEEDKSYSDAVLTHDSLGDNPFPMYEFLTIAIPERYQNNGIGTWLYCRTAEYASVETPAKHGVCRMWSKPHREDNHINGMEERFGAQRVMRDTEYMHDVKCAVCNEYDCACSGVVLLFPEKSWELTLFGGPIETET